MAGVEVSWRVAGDDPATRRVAVIDSQPAAERFAQLLAQRGIDPATIALRLLV